MVSLCPQPFWAALILSMLLSVCITSFPAQAEESDVLRIGTMILPPYGQEDSEGKEGGIIYEMNEEIGRRSGLAYTNRLYPFARMVDMLKHGELDLISSQPHEQSLEAGDKLAVQMHINVVLATRKGSCIESLDDLSGLTILYHLGASYPSIDDRPIQIYRVNSYALMLKMLRDRSDCNGGVFSEPAYYYWMHEMGMSHEEFGNVIVAIPNREQWIFVRKDMDLDLRRKLMGIVNDIREEGMYDDWLRKIKNLPTLE